MLLEQLPARLERMLDLGTGDGRLIDLILEERPGARAVTVDYSPPMLERARARFGERPEVEIVPHDLAAPLPDLGRFDAVVSSCAIHHLEHPRSGTRTRRCSTCCCPAECSAISSTSLPLPSAFTSGSGGRWESSTRRRTRPTAPGCPDPARLARGDRFRGCRRAWKWMEMAMLCGVKRATP